MYKQSITTATKRALKESLEQPFNYDMDTASFYFGYEFPKPIGNVSVCITPQDNCLVVTSQIDLCVNVNNENILANIAAFISLINDEYIGFQLSMDLFTGNILSVATMDCSERRFPTGEYIIAMIKNTLVPYYIFGAGMAAVADGTLTYKEAFTRCAQLHEEEPTDDEDDGDTNEMSRKVIESEFIINLKGILNTFGNICFTYDESDNVFTQKLMFPFIGSVQLTITMQQTYLKCCAAVCDRVNVNNTNTLFELIKLITLINDDCVFGSLCLNTDTGEIKYKCSENFAYDSCGMDRNNVENLINRTAHVFLNYGAAIRDVIDGCAKAIRVFIRNAQYLETHSVKSAVPSKIKNFDESTITEFEGGLSFDPKLLFDKSRFAKNTKSAGKEIVEIQYNPDEVRIANNDINNMYLNNLLARSFDRDEAYSDIFVSGKDAGSDTVVSFHRLFDEEGEE